MGQRLGIRPGLVGVDAKYRSGAAHRRSSAVRQHLDQHPFHLGERNAARRPETLRLRQGSVQRFAAGLQRCQARNGEVQSRLLTVISRKIRRQPFPAAYR
ncbi:Aldehyde dehydrogenase family protein [Serratia marcescens]|nr:Aldehyde dehydrogenase family protein [Serratia marcescens]